MNIGTALFLLLILACPLMMVFMMRGHGHGHGEHEHGDASAASVDQLRRRRDELDREIAAREGGDRYSWSSSPAVSPPADCEDEAQETNHRRALAQR